MVSSQNAFGQCTVHTVNIVPFNCSFLAYFCLFVQLVCQKTMKSMNCGQFYKGATAVGKVRLQLGSCFIKYLVASELDEVLLLGKVELLAPLAAELLHLQIREIVSELNNPLIFVNETDQFSGQLLHLVFSYVPMQKLFIKY